jgi:hypothetical protein
MSQLATFARVYVSDIEGRIDLFNPGPDNKVRLRFTHSSGLELALVGNVLILSGPADILEPFRSTQVTVIVDDLDAVMADAADIDAKVLRGPARQPTGRNVTIGYDNGATIEYVEWDSTTKSQAGL